LKDEINELKAKVAAIKQVAAQSSSQEPEESPAPTTSLPNPTPAPIPPANATPSGASPVNADLLLFCNSPEIPCRMSVQRLDSALICF
jgi:hypothetical protein